MRMPLDRKEMGTTPDSDRPGEGLGEFYPGRPFETVVTDHAALLLCLARKLVPSLGVDAEDLVQDALERAWRARGTFRVGAAERPWLVGILCNRAREISRARRPRWSPRGILPFYGASTGPAEWTDERDDEEEGVVRRAVAALPLHERTALVLHVCGGLHATEVAAVMGCSTGAAHKRIQRARAHLVRQLNWETGPQPPPTFPGRVCRQARRQLPAYLEGMLAERQRAALEAHVGACPRCPVVVQAVMGVMTQLATAADEGHHQPAPPELVARLRALVAAEWE